MTNIKKIIPNKNNKGWISNSFNKYKEKVFGLNDNFKKNMNLIRSYKYKESNNNTNINIDANNSDKNNIVKGIDKTNSIKDRIKEIIKGKKKTSNASTSIPTIPINNPLDSSSLSGTINNKMDIDNNNLASSSSIHNFFNNENESSSSDHHHHHHNNNNNNNNINDSNNSNNNTIINSNQNDVSDYYEKSIPNLRKHNIKDMDIDFCTKICVVIKFGSSNLRNIK